MTDEKDFLISRVITRNVIRDAFNGIRTFFGLRLRNFEELIQKNTYEMLEEMRLTYPHIKWYRISINPVLKDAIMLNIYGVYKDESD